MKKRITRDVKCKNCGFLFRTNQKNIGEKFEYCSVCRGHRKNCEVCGKEIFVQARTCNKKCAYELRKQSWKESCGTTHNFCKESSSRKQWEKRLLDEENITNVYQREAVKEKCKEKHLQNLGVDHPSKSEEIKNKKIETCLKNYNVKNGFCLIEKVNETMMRIYSQLRITNAEKISTTRRSPEFRHVMESKGLWIPLESLTEWEIYRYNVAQITYQSIKKYIDTQLFKENKNKNFKDRLTIDHKFSIITGFKNKISPEIIGSIVNLEILSRSKNSSKNYKCSITLNKLLNDYQNFINENKIDKKN